MTTKSRIGTIFRKDVGDSVFDQLEQVYPEGISGSERHAFWAELPVGDPRERAVLNVLTSVGFRPWSDTRRRMERGEEFGLEYLRVYDHYDLCDSKFLELRPPSEAHFHDTPRRDDGLIRLLQGYLKDDVDLGFTMTNWYVVPDRVKHILERSELIGLQFRPTLLLEGLYADAKSQPIPWERYGEPWWELDSDYTMPPLSDSMTLTDNDKKVVGDRTFANGFHRSEGLYMYPELHYRASAVANLPQFDVARTYESFGNRKGYDRLDCPLVVSNRFYKFFIDNGLKTGWLPVHIDPD